MNHIARNAVRDSRFADRFRVSDSALTVDLRRSLVFRYAMLYQDFYWFDQLESAFAFLEISGLRPFALPDELPVVLQQVEHAMGEYFESLNYVATALHRLFDDHPMNRDDVLRCIGLIWDAHACQEPLEGFRDREDAVLCGLLHPTSGANNG